MEYWTQRFLLTTVCLCGLTTPALAQQMPPSIEVITPEVERREITRAAIDTEDFEIGVSAGLISIQDFKAETTVGLRAAWHVTEDFFFEAYYGSSQGDQTSYEQLSGGAPLFTEEERDYQFYTLSLGWVVLPGEIFILDRYAFKSDFYLIGGAGSTEFLGDSWFTVSIGAGYRLLLNDWIALRIDVRDHLFDRDAFGVEETTNNIEVTTGLTFYF